jgi:VWFA-related protein
MQNNSVDRLAKFFLTSSLALGYALSAFAQAPEPVKPPASGEQTPAAESQQPPAAGVIRTESRLVMVDAVVRDKKGNYVRDLTEKDFKVYEDNKEQSVTTFSFGANPGVQGNDQSRYMVLFFDNSSMQAPDQIQARSAATKFIEKNAGSERLMAVVDFGGSLQVKQNFTASADLLKSAVKGVRTPNIETNSQSAMPVTVAANGLSSLGNSESDFGARTMLLSIRSLAKNLRVVPGRKMLILFSAGFPLDSQGLSELTATIDACNKANVAVYAIDVRGLVSGFPNASDLRRPGAQSSEQKILENAALHDGTPSAKPRLLNASYIASTPAATWDPQKPGGGGGGHGGGGTPGGGGTGGGKGGGTGGGTGGKGGGAPPPPVNRPPTSTLVNGYNYRSRSLIPQLPPSVSENQQILQSLAEGTGGFAIYNTNDLLGGLDRIGKEQNEFYLLGYVPQASAEESCHTLKVKMVRKELDARSRSGYCNTRPANPLEGKPIEKQMELQALGTQGGSIPGSMQVPYFYTAPNVARVNLAMEIPSDKLQFNKDKGKYHSTVNVLGIAYNADGSVGARFSDKVVLNLEHDDWKELTKQPYRYQNQFDAVPGTYKLTVILTAGGEDFGKFEQALKIDPYDGKKLTLGGVVLSCNVQRADAIPTDIDASLLEDRTPLVVKGMQINPSARYQFKKSEHLVLYSEVYEPLLRSEIPLKVATGYRIFDKSNKEVFFSGAIPMDEYIQKGNSVVPFGLKVETKDLPPGDYRLVLLAVDGVKNTAPNREVLFTLQN